MGHGTFQDLHRLIKYKLKQIGGICMKKKSNLGAITVGILIVSILVSTAIITLTGCDVQEEPVITPSETISGDNIQEGPIAIVTSLEDNIKENAAWCGTFNLIWNDLKEVYAKQDIDFGIPSEIVDHLNEGTFSVKDLSEDSYYKTHGIPTLELKEEIEKAIKDKFDEESDILDELDWSGNPHHRILYCMLKKEFEFPKVFTKLSEGTFGDNQTATYFGIDSSTKKEVGNQVKVLYYNSEDDFAVKLLTKQNDEVILTVGRNENNFLDIYNEIIEESKKYEGSYHFNDDRLKIPYIKFDLKEEIEEVENKPFLFADGTEWTIYKALQTIQFELDEKGGRVKSEAAIAMKDNAIMMPSEPRNLYVDEAFTIFLVEEGMELPYFAAKISDIDTIQ